MSHFEGQEDQRWAAQIRGGDRGAFKRLFTKYYEELYGFARSQVSDAEVSEDIVQDVFFEIWRRRHRFEPKSARAYLFGAVRNMAIKHIDRRRVRREWKEEQEHRAPQRGAQPDDGFHHRELQQRLRQSVEELPDRRRQVYVLSRQHGLTYKEIAEAMDISPKTVENQMVRALKHLRERLRRFLPSML